MTTNVRCRRDDDLPHRNHRHHPPSNDRRFTVVLEHPDDRAWRRPLPACDIDDLILLCPSRHRRRAPPPQQMHRTAVAMLIYDLWHDALEALLYFWRRRLDSDGAAYDLPVPRVLSNDPACRAQERARLREIFAAYARGLLGCHAVRKVEKKLEGLCLDVDKVDAFLKDKNSMKVFSELQERKRGFVEERERLLESLDEFREGIQSILRSIEEEEEGSGVVEVFNLRGGGGRLDWRRIHYVLLRECRRLEEGLPVYACRRRILKELHSNQVMVLIGETGSGKSTQLVQFLADSGLATDGVILCTQPRRIAAMSIAQRVGAEGYGCYPNKFIDCYPTYSLDQGFNSKIIFLTDNCLLQHCMNNMSLAGISYILVDEAHERSLNTDLLLALIKKQLLLRVDLRLIIMSATADGCKLSDYYYGCQSLSVKGRTFPVDIKYIHDVSGEVSSAAITMKVSGNVASYVSDAVKMATVILQTEESGDILAFLTAQVEVEWACENFCSPSAVALPLHGKLSCEDQSRVFQKYPGKRKVIFCTNLAETSLTIPGIKYVIDSGMVKESRFEATSGMNVLRVCPVSQSSARQRAGRAGRMEPGKCYRLYSQYDFDGMPLFQEPEIRKVHLGIAILKILALGVSNVEDFEFIDAPSASAIDMAIRNLIHLGAVTYDQEVLRLTPMGCQLVKLGTEPRLGKLILESIACNLGKEGLVLAAVMANSSSIFCRVGSDEDKAKSDCLKVPFCHHEGDLFTLLSVYKEWELEGDQDKNQWCWQNGINAKSMRRCRDIVEELENCLKHELKMIIPSYWSWSPNEPTFDRLLKKVILHCLPENVAMYSGCERLGYEVALTGEHVQLHPSCSFLMFGNKPNWVVFGDILSTSKQYLVCVTAIDRESLCALDPPLFDVSNLEEHKLQKTVITGLGTHLLERLCGKGNLHLHSLISHIRMACKNSRAEINADFKNMAIQLFASLDDMEVASSLLSVALDCEMKWLRDECMEKSLFQGVQNAQAPVALFGRGAEIKHLELEKRYLTVEIKHSAAQTIDDKQLLRMVDQFAPGIAGFIKHVLVDSDKWGSITFLNPTIAEEAVRKLNGKEFSGSFLKVCPGRSTECYHKIFPSHAVKAKVHWPCSGSEPVDNSIKACEEALLREILPFFSVRTSLSRVCHVEVFNPEPKDFVMKAMITFDGSLHLEAAKALDHLQGKALPCCQPWQKIGCQRLFRSSIACRPCVYRVIKKDLDSVLHEFRNYEGASCELDVNDNGSCRVKILANATKKIADLRKPLELLMEGKTVNNTSLTSAALKLLLLKEGRDLMLSVAREKGTYILYDKYKSILKIFGSGEKVSAAEHVLISSLSTLHKKKELEIPLLSSEFPLNLMQEVIRRFGPDLHGLKEKVPGADFLISTRSQILSVQGDLEQKEKAQQIICEVAESLGSRSPTVASQETTCAICLCELEERYRLGACGHDFCRNCLLQQCESVIKSHDGFPLCCAHKDCKAPFLLMDLQSLLSDEKLEELFRASLGAFVASSRGAYRFCPSPDCPSIYKVADADDSVEPFVCGACSAETCTKCHLEYHPFFSCDLYKKFKEHPDSSLIEWRKGKEHVKNCPVCGYTIEKIDGCNHIKCRCGKHICWVCLVSSDTSDECYSHLRSVHQAIA